MKKYIIGINKLTIYRKINKKTGKHMHKNKTLAYFILIVLMISMLVINVSSEEDSLSFWNNEWSYREEIVLPIDTADNIAKYQPIDISFEFKQKCWAKNEQEHSVRVCSWDGDRWYELESQIYDLKEIDSSFHIKKCGIVFLIPEFADGNERYFIYYDHEKKSAPSYKDHVDVEDSYYYYEPIKGVSAEGDYYKITENGYCVFGVGQKGKVIHRKLSQAVIKLKPNTKDFDITKSDNIATFCFSYHKGKEFEDEISSDAHLVAKQMLVDGNLMVEFRIISESEEKNLRTSNIYKYYYCPSEEKRMNVHVKHETLKDDHVEGIINVDGRYGAIVSFQSVNERIKKMRFGKILPYLHVYKEDNKISEYQMDPDPEGTKREWIIPYTDDCDLGKKAWFSYDEGTEGKAQAIIFRSNTGIIKHGKERDGIQMKVAEKEYMDALGTEIDYAAINFGRNSYEKGGSHDLKIRSGLTVEYDAEFFQTENGGYPLVEKEVDKYQKLIEHRNFHDAGSIDEEQKIYTITVLPGFTGRIMSHPFFSDIAGIKITSVYGELYQDEKLILKQYTKQPFFGPPLIKFPKLAAGNYSIKIYRDIGKKNTMYIGYESVQIKKDEKIVIFCTWPKKIQVHLTNQYGDTIKDFKLELLKGDDIIDKHIFSDSENLVFTVPANIGYKYHLNGSYKGFKIFTKEINFLQTDIDEKIHLYDLSIDIDDTLGFPPGVNIHPYLTSPEMEVTTKIYPDKNNGGRYIFNNLPDASYKLHVSYGSYSETADIEINSRNKDIDLDFKVSFNLDLNVLDSRGNNVDDDNYNVNIFRNKKEIYSDIPSAETISLPPGEYQIYALLDGEVVGFKNIILANDKDTKIVTNIDPVLPVLVNALTIIFLIEMIVIFLLKRISLNSFLKIVAIALILISIFQPWWYLHATSDELEAEKTTELYIEPQVMIDKIKFDSQEFYDLATIPEIFTNFVGILLLIICSGFVLLGISFIPNLLLKKRFSLVLILASVLFLILVAAAFYFGMSKLTELSLGSMQGQGPLNVDIPTKNTVSMNATWGLGTGFFLCIIAALIAFFGGLIDFFKKKSWITKIIKKN